MAGNARVIFQSTLPARGATSMGYRVRTAGADFNPRSPHGERRNPAFRPSYRRNFNPRSPHGERQMRRTSGGRLHLISIHAPRTGSDPPACGSCSATRYFNPRSPHGERPRLSALMHGQFPFQSTLPARGATYRSASTHALIEFQSTLPARGATVNCSISLLSEK